jgi:HAD superfamily hydrolase (TIGR01484 family)
MVLTIKNRDRIREIFRVYRKWERGEKVFPSQVLDDDVEHYHLNYEDAEKAVYFHSGMELETVQNGLSEYFDVTKLSFQDGTTGSGEVTQKGITKAEGMEAVANHLGLKSEDVIAFGDGPNDSEMFDYAGFSVAMGNAIPDLKERAGYVTTDILEDGIYNALLYLELI